MLKKKFSIIALSIILIISLALPVVRAEDEDLNNDANAEQNTVVTTSADNEQETSAVDSSLQNFSDENYKQNDVYLTGDDITIDYIVDGNLFVIANSVTINAQIGGDAFICANTVNISEEGYILNNLFTLAKDINIKGVVYDLYTLSQNTNIDGYIYRDMKASTGNLNIAGIIGRNAFVNCSNINFSDNSTSDDGSTITSKGRIAGNLNYSSENEFDISNENVQGTINYTKKIANKTSNKNISDYIMSAISFIITVILIALICKWLAPKFSKECNTLLTKNTWGTLAYGILTPIILVVAFIALLVLNITSSFALLLIPLFILLLLLGTSIFVIAFNNIICEKFKFEKTTQHYASLAVSALVLWIIKLIPVVGSLVSFVASLFGIGIIAYSIIPHNAKKSETTENSENNKTENKNN